MGRVSSIAQTPEAGFLYVIGFDTRIVKAGRSCAPDRRADEHRRDAARFGVQVVNVWTSGYIEDSHEGERMLLGRLGAVGQRADAGREYFRGVPFAVARHEAEIVVGQRKLHPASCNCCDGARIIRLTASVVDGPASTEPGEFTAMFRLAGGDQIEAQLNDPDLGPAGRYPLRPGDTLEIDLEQRGRSSWEVWGTYPTAPQVR